MRAGIMRNAADIQNVLTVVADTGEMVYSYIQASGEEKWEVRMRYRSDVGYNTRIQLWTGDGAFIYLKVNAIEDIGNKHKDLRIGCERMYA
jgi:carbohydrate-selective porin OprB